jgi:dTDP-4-dehydrorhamnose reductase
VNPTTSAAYAATATRQTAERPAYSVLGHDRWTTAGLAPIGHWRASLHRAFPAVLSATPA